MTAGTGPAPGARAVHQFVPALIPRDATGSHTLLLRRALRAAGWRSEIFAEATHDELAGESIDVTRYDRLAEPGDVLVYQFSTSSMVADLLCGRPEPLVLDFHNVTGPEHYEGWEPETARRAAAALDQLHRLAPRSVLGLADSAFNEHALRRAGCRRTTVVPPLVDLDRLAEPDRRVAGRLMTMKTAGGPDWLFVGRLVPSKAQHDLVKALWVAHRLYDERARLHLVGPASSGRYLGALRAFVADLGLERSVHLAGEVSDAALAAYYEAADVYVSLSAHEGFGVPLLEAMRSGVPVVALDIGAVADTVGNAGLVLDGAAPSLVAGAVDRVVRDDALRRRLVAAGRARTSALSLDTSAAAAVDALATVAGPAPAGAAPDGVAAQPVGGGR